MKSILFLDMHREGRSPSQRFRYEQYLPLLSKNGFRVHHSFLLNENDDKIFYSQGKYLGKAWLLLKSIAKRWNDVARAGKYDFIFIQREAFMLGTTFFETLLSRSKAKIIFDFDDSIWLPQVSSTSPNKKLNFLKNPGKTARIISLADCVVAGNQYLADYALQFNPSVKIIPTTINTELYSPKPKESNKIITIGWSGSKTTIDHFKEALPALEVIKNKYGNRVAIDVIGDNQYRNEKLGITGKAWSLANEINDLLTFDIGIMPLPDDEWSKGKCGLKGLQYMALEIPTLMSPIGVNKEIIQHGKNGFLCTSTEEWVKYLSLLIEDSELRAQTGTAGRQTVLERYSVNANASLFLLLFEL
ncbi:MAG: glycosyltransferase family 4 protein [Cyclobacteriaceae bacterium]|mgnify:CR=1 FL=1|nr:glycosyltransferase family 4 protein [Cyclobacteriaceae bacterium]